MLNRLQAVFASFHSHDLRYVVIGGIAAVLHGVPRATFDLDILIEPTEENAGRLLAALRAVGFGTADLTTAKGIVENEITVFSDRVRIAYGAETGPTCKSLPGKQQRRRSQGVVVDNLAVIRGWT